MAFVESRDVAIDRFHKPNYTTWPARLSLTESNPAKGLVGASRWRVARATPSLIRRCPPLPRMTCTGGIPSKSREDFAGVWFWLLSNHFGDDVLRNGHSRRGFAGGGQFIDVGGTRPRAGPEAGVDQGDVGQHDERLQRTILGQSFLPVAHRGPARPCNRPRDIALAMDLSSSIAFGTCSGFDFYTTSRTTNNPDTTYPTFGHYSTASSSLCTRVLKIVPPLPTTVTRFPSPTNTTTTTSAYDQTDVNKTFYQNAAYASNLDPGVLFLKHQYR